MRLVLGIVFVKAQMSQKEIVSKLLAYAASVNVSIKAYPIYFDRGYDSVELYQYLEQQAFLAVLACPIRGKTHGTKGLCVGNKTYQTHYTFNSQVHGTYQAKLAVVWTFRLKKAKNNKGKPRQGVWLIYVLINTSMTAKKAHKTYKYRFGIETSYRQLNQARVRSNSSNPMMRFVYMAVGLILLNVWIVLNFFYCQLPKRGRGGRPIDITLFPFHLFRTFIAHAVVAIYGLVRSIQAHAYPIGL